jgi:hypothetical protein
MQAEQANRPLYRPDDRDGGPIDPSVKALLDKNREITRKRQARAREKAEAEIRRAEEMKKWLDEQDEKRKKEFAAIMDERKRKLERRHEDLARRRKEREEFRRKADEDAAAQGPASPHRYLYSKLERDFKERYEVPELERRKQILEEKKRQIR